MDKPFASLSVWQVLLIAFFVAVVAHIFMCVIRRDSIVVRADGSQYLHTTFFGMHPKNKKEHDKIALGGTNSKPTEEKA